MPNLLIVDDDIYLRKLILNYGEREGFNCFEAGNSIEAKTMLKAHAFDMIILDVMMPGEDGFDLLVDIRTESAVPVIMLTARDEEYDKLYGFEIGADDYVAKPFSPKELMARVHAVLKRYRCLTSDEICFGKLAIHPASRQVRIDEDVISLPPKEYDLLIYLTQNVNIALHREQLLNRIWGYDYSGDTRTLDTHIKSLRDHLGEYRENIKTVWGVGYKFEYHS
ncbi:MAG: two-component system, OmpR family, response regulator ResD [Clostridiales bacterium]|jgi:DNA-binding response OmpR family regulator|nr:two-component system, OmpR family, response regulator ResD [Clostridiales bacterium]MDN5298104.1 two-component system, OmpR family, response regulator ResD [Clostridiales bacterium]